MLNLWNTRSLADDIAAERIAPSRKGAYYVFAAVFYMVFSYLGSAGPEHYSLMYLYEGIVVCAITFVGARRVVAAYPGDVDPRFFETTFLLAIPLTVKVIVALWVGIYGTTWLIDTGVDYTMTRMEEPSRAVAYWADRAHVLVPFVFSSAVAVVFWLRLAHHVGYVVGKRNAQP